MLRLARIFCGERDMILKLLKDHNKTDVGMPKCLLIKSAGHRIVGAVPTYFNLNASKFFVFETMFRLTAETVVLIALSVYGVKAAPHNSTDGHKHSNCYFVTEMTAAFNESFVKCKEELKLSDIPDIGEENTEVYEKYFENVAKNGMDDRCLARCMMETIKITTSSGSADLTKIEKLYRKGNMTDEVVKIVMKEWSACNDKADKSYPESKEKDKLCRKAAFLDKCLFDRGQEVEICL